MFARLGNDGSPGSSGRDSPINLSSLTAKLEAAKYESKYGSKVDRKKAAPTQTKITVTGLGKLVVTSGAVEVRRYNILIEINTREMCHIFLELV